MKMLLKASCFFRASVECLYMASRGLCGDVKTHDALAAAAAAAAVWLLILIKPNMKCVYP